MDRIAAYQIFIWKRNFFLRSGSSSVIRTNDIPDTRITLFDAFKGVTFATWIYRTFIPFDVTPRYTCQHTYISFLRWERLSMKTLCLFVCLLLTCACNCQSVPRSSHVWIITEENHSYEDVVGNPQMPYYNQLIDKYALATQFYSDQHSSLPALMWFVAGAPVELNNNTTSCNHTQDNVVRELLRQHYTWRTYQENMPSAGYQGLYGGVNNSYYRRHNPLIDFSDVCPGTGQELNSVPFSQMAEDFAQNKNVNLHTSHLIQTKTHTTARSQIQICGWRRMFRRF